MAIDGNRNLKKKPKKKKSKAPKKNSGCSILHDWRQLQLSVQEKFIECQGNTCYVKRILGDMAPVTGGKGHVQSKLDTSQLAVTAPSISVVDAAYTGPHVTFPVTLQVVRDVMQHLKGHPDSPIHPKYVMEILTAAKELLRKAERVNRIDMAGGKNKKVLVVGGLHGQLADLLCIVDRHGLPSPGGTCYLFNGGLVDYGSHGVEVLVLILLMKLLYPTAVYINRGSHEDPLLNACFGFLHEVQSKYKIPGMMNLFHDVFSCLPVATVIDKFALVVHSGLPRYDGVNLEVLENTPRLHDVPSRPSTFNEVILFDLLWATPKAKPGRSSSTQTTQFGIDITEQFLEANNLQVLIRSHWIPENLAGSEVTHDGQCWTVFSGSNLCGKCGNLGGVLELQKEGYYFHEHWGPSLCEYATQAHLDSSAACRDTTSAEVSARADIQQLLGRCITENRQELLEYLRRYDKKQTGLIPLERFISSLTDILGLQVPWIEYLGQLELLTTTSNTSTMVQYVEFLKLYRLEGGQFVERWRQAAKKRIHDRIVELGVSLDGMRDKFDLNRDGRVTVMELTEGLLKLGVGLSEAQLTKMLRTFQLQDSEAIDLAKFVESVSLKLTLPTEYQEILNALAECLKGNFQDLQTAFKKFDCDRDGFLSYSEFTTATQSLLIAAGQGTLFTASKLTRVAESLDTGRTGKVNYMQFADAMATFCKGEIQVDDVEQALLSNLYRHRVPLLHAFEVLDAQGAGVLAPEYVKRGLQAVNYFLAENVQLSPEDIEALVASMDVDTSGCINYGAFLNSIAIFPVESLPQSRGDEIIGDLQQLDHVELTLINESLLSQGQATDVSSPLSFGGSLITAPLVTEWTGVKRGHKTKGTSKVNSARSARTPVKKTKK